MKTFETARDVLNNARELHHLAAKLYQQLKSQTSDDRAGMLLGYMIDHENKMEQNLIRYEDHAPEGVLGTWIQFTLEETPQVFIDELDISSGMSVEQIADMGHQVDAYLVNLFEEVMHTATNNNVKDVFKSLMDMEKEEKYTLTRAANSLWEL